MNTQLQSSSQSKRTATIGLVLEGEALVSRRLAASELPEFASALAEKEQKRGEREAGILKKLFAQAPA